MEKGHTYNYLALGDSYTIGEQVPIYESYPYGVVQLLRRSGRFFHAPEIIAKTGWTTGELISAIQKTTLLPSYDFVTLLIGVNNQYRGLPISEYEVEFEQLVQISLKLSGQRPEHVAVLSIPNWGRTPFAEGRDRALIGSEIDAFNRIIHSIAEKFQVGAIDITIDSGNAQDQPGLLSSDGLHPSGAEYRKWSKKIFEFISSRL
jgi:lysophospholipase L1-like esterase